MVFAFIGRSWYCQQHVEGIAGLHRRRVQPLPVIDHARFGGPTATGFGTPGSLILFLCRTRDDMSNALRTLAGGETAMKGLMARVSKQMDRLRPGTVDDVARAAARSESIAALTYGGAPVVDPIWLPQGLDLTVVAIPYSGGHLLREGFRLVEYVKTQDVRGYAAFVLKSAPKLTVAERTALKKVPKHLHGIHVGHGYKCELTALAALSFGVAGAVGGAVVGAAAGGVAGAIVGGGAGGLAGAVAGAAVDAAVTNALEGKRFEHNVHLSKEDIRKLGQSRSAKTLVNKRRAAMLKAHRPKHHK